MLGRHIEVPIMGTPMRQHPAIDPIEPGGLVEGLGHAHDDALELCLRRQRITRHGGPRHLRRQEDQLMGCALLAPSLSLFSLLNLSLT